MMMFYFKFMCMLIGSGNSYKAWWDIKLCDAWWHLVKGIWFSKAN